MGISTLASAFILVLCYPETQYTRETLASIRERSVIDSLRFWRVSGGGRPKVHRYVIDRPEYVVRALTRCQLLVSLPISISLHPPSSCFHLNDLGSPWLDELTISLGESIIRQKWTMVS